MDVIEIIDKKRLNQELNFEELKYIVMNYVNGNIPDYQMSALLMAIVLNGMTEQETIYLTDIMIESGEKIDLSSLSNNVVDKHSTGGIGDKTTLVLAPLVASCGVKVAKMSGRGLGYTGGTIDKLESINGFQTQMNFSSFLNQIETIGIAIVSQMENLVPADKKIYALRDVTATTSSIPLIASSIMSKKIASGANNIVLDVKVGEGALVKTLKEAETLANLMVKIGENYNCKVVCVLTEMNRPLGRAIGNSLEVMEAINTLRGKGPKDVEELVITLGSYMVSLAKKISLEEARIEIQKNLENGLGLKKFLEFVKVQGGDIDTLKVAEKEFSVKSNKTGFVKSIDALKLGKLVRDIGGGRKKKEDIIDYQVGFLLSKQVGDYVLEDEELVKVFLNEKDLSITEILDCFIIENIVGEVPLLIKKVIE